MSSTREQPTSILMVCLGNICRSPLAEVIMRKVAADRGVAVRVESCGTGGYHVGEGAHPGSLDIARARGLDLSAHCARQFDASCDFEGFDWIVCMDTSNRNNVRHQDAEGRYTDKTVLLLDYARGSSPRDVPDPYFTGGFDEVYRLIEDGCTGFLEHIVERSGRSR